MRQTLARALLIIVTLFVLVIYYVPIGHVDFAENWGEGYVRYHPSAAAIDRYRPLSPIRSQIARECGPAIVWSRTVTTKSRRECAQRIRASVKR